MSRPNPPPFVVVTGGLPFGGSTTLLLNLLVALQRRGIRWPIISLDRSPSNAMEKEPYGLEADMCCVAAASRLIYEDRLRWAYEQLSQLQPEAVIAWLGPESFELLRLLPPGVLRVGVIHSHDPGPYAVARLYAPWLDVTVGVSAEISDELRAIKELAGKQIVEIPCGIVFPDDTPEVLPRDGAQLRVIYLGRIVEEQKRISRYVDLIRRARSARLPIEFTFAGSGPQEDWLKTQLANTPQVRFAGSVPHADVPELLREHDVFLLLSDYEGLPVSLLEAMSEGLVPVVSDLPSGIRQAVPNGCGIRVPIGDVEAALASLTRLSQDRHKIAAISAKARRHVRDKFSAERMADDYLALLSSRPESISMSWPELSGVLPPLGIKYRWLYRGLPRRLRRWLNRMTN